MLMVLISLVKTYSGDSQFDEGSSQGVPSHPLGNYCYEERKNCRVGEKSGE